MTDRILGDLNQNLVARLQRLLDPARLPVKTCGLPVHLAGVQHSVAALAKVDEGGLHARQDVLNSTEVDVAHHRGLLLARHVVLHENVVLKHGDLRHVTDLADHHGAVNALAASKELGLGDDGTAAASIATFATAKTLGLKARRPLQRRDLVTST